MRKLRVVLMGFAILLAFFSLSLDDVDEHGAKEAVTVDFGSLHDVVRVVDGDTIVVLADEEEIKVRFIGVNTPESVHEDESRNTEYGKEAAVFTENLLDSRRVYLVYDEDKEDDYGRTLAYVYTEDKQFINLLLVEKGYAECMRIEPNVKYASEFEEAESAAKAADKGFWENGFFPE